MNKPETKLWYKLTDQQGQTYGGTQWGERVHHEASGKGYEFCTRDLIYIYSNPLVGLLHNPMHANFSNPLIWLARASEPVYSDLGLKHGAKQVTTLHTISTPEIPVEARVHYAILCAKEGINPAKNQGWLRWAEHWLSGKDRNASAAYAVSPGHIATSAAAYAAGAARAAAYAANCARVEAAAAYAADAAGYAAMSSAIVDRIIDFPRLAEKAVAIETALLHRACPTDGPCCIDPNTGHTSAF